VDVLIAGAKRTPFARRNGALQGWHAVDLLADVLQRTVDAYELDPSIIDAVIASCATPVGEQALNIGRNAVLAAGWPESIPASTVDGAAISGQSALHHACALVGSGMASVVVVGGVEASSRVPVGASTGVAVGKPYGPSVHARYEARDGLVPPGLVAERLAQRHKIDRDALDAFAQASRTRAIAARDSGAFKAELLAVQLRNEKGVATSAWIEHDDIDAAADFAALQSAFEVDGLITAGNMALPADGAAAVIVMSDAMCEQLNIDPLARFVRGVQRGTDVLEGDSGAALFGEVVQSIADTYVDVHEDTAATPLAFVAETKCEAAAINPCGGAVAIGDAPGASGVRMVTTAAHAIERGAAKRAAVLTAGAGGLAAITTLARP
jgi:acetyl-CoA acyltransferase